MAVFADCSACFRGDHENHVEHWGVRPPGVIDGEFCHCNGDCEERSQARYDKFMGVFDE